MLVRDIMTTNVVTVPSNMQILEARKILETHKIRRLPVVDKGKLVGILTKNMTRRVTPSEATSLTVWEINYLMSKMTVREIMKKDPVTVTPGITVECAVATAQKSGVGALPVIEGNLVVGIVTTNDFFYKIFNPLLGIEKEGKRIIIYDADDPAQITKIMGVLANHGVGIKAMHTIAFPDADSHDLIIHLDTEDAIDIMSDINKMGFQVNEREHKPC